MIRRILFFAFAASLVVACSKEDTPKEKSDAGFVGREGDTDPDPTPVDPDPVDPGPQPDASTGDGDSGGSCTTKIVINELLTEGGAINKEFVELYNPNTCDVVIEGFKLRYKSASGMPTQGTLLHTFAAGTTIKAKGYYVLGTAQYTGMKDVQFSATDNTGNGFLSNNGQVALFDAMDVKMDGIGYGTLTGGDYTEKTAAVSATQSASIGRKPNGGDTDDNSKDCTFFSSPTPGAANGP
jgi:hypothetical protein